MTDRVQRITRCLEEALQPTCLTLSDESAQHAGHAGVLAGGHFSVLIVSKAFEGKRLVQRHQQVYQALGDMMQKEIHALSIKAYTPSEYSHEEK